MNLRKTLLLVLFLASVLTLRSQTRKPAAAAPVNRDQEAVNTIRKLEDEMRMASLKGDAGWWVAYLDDKYTDTDAQGKVMGKAEVVEMHRSSELIYETVNFSDRNVHTYNGDTVIITGRITLVGAHKGQSLSGDYQFTRVWTKMGLEWKLAASQATRIAP